MYIMARCRVCDRTITNSLSIKRGVGAKCYRKWRKGYRGIQLGTGENMRELAKKLEKG